MLNLLNRLLKAEVVFLVLLGSAIAIYTAADAIETNSQDSHLKEERLYRARKIARTRSVRLGTADFSLL